MAERKKTPNILADLLGDKSPASDFETSDLETDTPQQGAIQSLHARPDAVGAEAPQPDPTEPDTTQDSASQSDASQSQALPSGAKESVKTPRQEAVLPVKRLNGLAVKQHDSVSSEVPIQDESNEEADGGGLGNKVKVTFYLSEEAVDLLEEAQRKLRRLARGAGKTQSKAVTSKSALLEEALKLACADLESAGAQSQLARILF